MEHISEPIERVVQDLELKPIPTTYSGIRYRSRLEARWSIFLAELGIEFRYEYEGYQLASGYYVPDFWLPKQSAWLEIKPLAPSFEQAQLCHELAEMTRSQVWLAAGLPQQDDGITVWRWAHGAVFQDECYAICECPKCHAIGAEHQGKTHRICGDDCFPGSDRGRIGWLPRMKHALLKAERERFWDPD